MRGCPLIRPNDCRRSILRLCLYVLRTRVTDLLRGIFSPSKTVCISHLASCKVFHVQKYTSTYETKQTLDILSTGTMKSSFTQLKKNRRVYFLRLCQLPALFSNPKIKYIANRCS